MSTRVKLFLSYLVMGFLPILLLIAITIMIMARVAMNSPFLMSLSDNQGQMLNAMDKIISMEAKARDNTASLFDKSFLEQASTDLKPFHTGIILLDTDNQVFYASSYLDEKIMVPQILDAENNAPKNPHLGAEHFNPLGYRKVNIDSKYMILSRKLENESLGKLYLVIETGSAKDISNGFAKRSIALLFWGMTGLILLMTFLVTHSMMQSLRKLKAGVRHISEGDLNFSIQTKKKDEVAQVVMAFEEMRLRLKTSIEAQVREDENRKELVANISHDLKTPVTAIKGYIEGLIDGVADTPEKREKYLTTILGKTVALDRMIDDLFLYSSLDTGRTSYHFETVPAKEFFDSLCNETTLDLTERGFEVACQVDIPSDTQIKLDRQMIHRLQHNLTENAAKYCRETGRKVTFSARLDGREILCYTQDNGIGIQESELPHIFDRFYRADAARTSTIGGTGLGLQISRRIVEDHHGRIWADSTYGEFTRISWVIPVALPAASEDPRQGGRGHA